MFGRKATVVTEAEALQRLMVNEARRVRQHLEQQFESQVPFSAPFEWEAPMGSGHPVSNALATAVAVVEMPELESIGTVAVEVPEEDLADMRKHLAMEAEAVLGYAALRQKMESPSALRCVLAKLEIEIRDAEAVQKYKEQVSAHYKTSGKMLDPTWIVTPLQQYMDQVPEFALSKAIEIKKEVPAAEFYVEHFKEDPFLIVTTHVRSPMLYTQDLGRHGTLGKRAAAHPEDTAYLDVWDEKAFEAPAVRPE